MAAAQAQLRITLFADAALIAATTAVSTTSAVAAA
jgi:hypothetical protein